MKQKFTFMKVFMSLILLCGVSSAWADAVTFTPNKETSTSKVEVDPVTFTFTNGSTSTTWYDDGLRFYEGATITVSSEVSITKIEFTHTNKNAGCLNLTSSDGTYSSKTWTGNAKSIAFKVTHSTGSSNGQVRLTKVVVTYADSKTKAYLKYENAGEQNVLFGTTLSNIAKVYSDEECQNELSGAGTISYSSSNSEYISVNEDGTITPVKEGYADITAYFSSETHSADAITYKAIAKYKYDAPTLSATAIDGEKKSYDFTGKLQVALTKPEGTSNLYYTINDGSQQIYTEPFEISETSQINAWASDTEGLISKSKKLTYTKVAFNKVTLADENIVLITSFESAKVVLPTRTLAGYTFEGWSTTNCDEATKTKPTIIEAGEYTPVEDVTLYPIFSYTEEGESGDKTAESTAMTASDKVQTLEKSKPITYVMSSSNDYSKPLRIYKNSTITFEGALITKIELQDAGNDSNPVTNLNLNEGQSGELSKTDGNVTWTGSASKVVLKASSGQARTSKITVYYTAADIFYVSKKCATTIEITNAGWATACLPFNATITSNNATAYYVTDIVTGINESSIEKTEANVIPAGEGILLKSNNGAAATVEFTISSDDADDATGNMLKGSLTGETFSQEGYHYYILTNGTKGIGFYWDITTEDSGASASCGAGKAVLEVKSAKANNFFTFEDVTAIESVKNETANAKRYNLNGQAVGADYKGIVIMNGKKMFNK